MKSKVFVVMRVFISLALVALLFWFMRGKLGNIKETLRTINISVFIYALGISCLAALVFAFRFKVIISTHGFKISSKEAVSLTFIGYFFNNFLPTALGGDLVKGYYASRRIGKKLPVFTAIFVDRFIGAMTFFIFAALALLALGIMGKSMEHPRLTNLVWAMLAVAGFSCLFFLNRRLAGKFQFLIRPFRIFHLDEKLKKLYNVINSYKDHKKALGKALFLSITGQLLAICTMYCLTIAIGAKVWFIWILLLVPVIAVISMLPSLGGLGVREGATVVFLGPLIGPEKAFAVSLLGLGIFFLLSLIGGVIYVLDKQYRISYGKAEWVDAKCVAAEIREEENRS